MRSSEMKIDVQLSPAAEPWPALRDGVLAAEEAGFDAAWVFDHFDGALLSGAGMLECFTLLGALAASTTTIGLGSLVVNVNNRVPGVLAQCAASAQALSNGRFVLGIGAGAVPGQRWASEHAELGIALGTTLAERHARLEHALDELDRFWSRDRPESLATFALPSSPPPVIVGVNSERLARIAGARAAGINVRASHDHLAAIITSAEAARREAGRTHLPWDCSVWTWFDPALLDPEHPDRVRWASLGVGRLVLVWLTAHDPVSLATVRPHP
jgi:alkanesulfonate monooxygenase SsuD/methylene tetrahydromethanopterin reductase-like flavin-dependent oxidoreductase (luciferase family)